MGLEIEKKFLVKKERWEQVEAQGISYQQGYLLRQEDKTVRIRLVEGEGGYITIKGKTERASRPEYEYAIPQKDAKELLHHFCEAVVVKKRHKVTVAGKLWEVDVFMDDNEGLIVAELELDDEDEPFELPDWVDKEVTGDQRYYNSQLSVDPYKNWKREDEKRTEIF